jgi:hypothetical protein
MPERASERLVMPGKGVESTNPSSAARRGRSMGKRADGEPRTGDGWKKSYPAGWNSATIQTAAAEREGTRPASLAFCL